MAAGSERGHCGSALFKIEYDVVWLPRSRVKDRVGGSLGPSIFL